MNDSRQADVQVTRKMIEAGVYAIREATFGSDLAEVVESIYYAMEYERLEGLGVAT